MKLLNQIRDSAIALLVIDFSVYGLWVGLELAYYGEVQPRSVDNAIGLLLIWSLYFNFIHWRDQRKERRRAIRARLDGRKIK